MRILRGVTTFSGAALPDLTTPISHPSESKPAFTNSPARHPSRMPTCDQALSRSIVANGSMLRSWTKLPNHYCPSSHNSHLARITTWIAYACLDASCSSRGPLKLRSLNPQKNRLTGHPDFPEKKICTPRCTNRLVELPPTQVRLCNMCGNFDKLSHHYHRN